MEWGIGADVVLVVLAVVIAIINRADASEEGCPVGSRAASPGPLAGIPPGVQRAVTRR